MAAMSLIVRGGATKVAGRAFVPGDASDDAFFGIASGTLARPFAALSAFLTHSVTAGFAFFLHGSRSARSRRGPMQLKTNERPTVSLHWTVASCGVSADAGSMPSERPRARNPVQHTAPSENE